MPLMEFAEFDRRPILVAIAGPNGAGKTTFFHAHLAPAGLRFVNADVLADELAVSGLQTRRSGRSRPGRPFRRLKTPAASVSGAGSGRRDTRHERRSP